MLVPAYKNWPVLLFFMNIYFVFLLILLTNVTFGQEPSATRITKHIHKLASDNMKGRGTGSPENAKAARYIEKYFKKQGLSPLGTMVIINHLQPKSGESLFRIAYEKQLMSLDFWIMARLIRLSSVLTTIIWG
ncbi:hypothetical protein [Spirosoma telluris]|uniref:hypothetical protein n=1 Tax=Spirosoma telluris TaxID=2183553 RepID=UPI002FC2EA32